MSSGKKFLHRKSEGAFSPISNLRDAQVSAFKLPKQSGNKEQRSPNKENVQVLTKKAERTPVASVGKRRGRNDRSAFKSFVEKPTKEAQVPFAAQDTNSPMKLRIQPEQVNCAAKSDGS